MTRMAQMLVVVGLVLAGSGMARAAEPVVAPALQVTPVIEVKRDELVIPYGSLAAIGLGVIGGVVVFKGVLGVPHLLSAIAGGAIGHWWYREYEKERGLGPSQYRAPSRFALDHANDSPALQARWLGEAAK